MIVFLSSSSSIEIETCMRNINAHFCLIISIIAINFVFVFVAFSDGIIRYERPVSLSKCTLTWRRLFELRNHLSRLQMELEIYRLHGIKDQMFSNYRSTHWASFVLKAHLVALKPLVLLLLPKKKTNSILLLFCNQFFLFVCAFCKLWLMDAKIGAG